MNHVFNSFAVICYLINGQGEILLQYKRKGFGTGKWNGPGGKVEPGENSEQAVIREVKEETGLDISNPEKRGELEFIFPNKKEWNLTAHVYVTKNFSGELMASDEGELKWFKIDELPLSQMWSDDSVWLKELLRGNFQKKRFYLDEVGGLLSFEEI